LHEFVNNSGLQLEYIAVVKKTFRYSNVFFTTVQSLMPHFRISEHYYGKPYEHDPTASRILIMQKSPHMGA